MLVPAGHKQVQKNRGLIAEPGEVEAKFLKQMAIKGTCMWDTRFNLANQLGHEPAEHQAQQRLADLGAEIHESHAWVPCTGARSLKVHAILVSPLLRSEGDAAGKVEDSRTVNEL